MRKFKNASILGEGVGQEIVSAATVITSDSKYN